jgi:hypothetical protein
VKRRLVALTLLLAACGRSSLLGLDDGCPQGTGHCSPGTDGFIPPDGFVPPDGFIPPDGGLHDLSHGDGFVPPEDMFILDAFVPPDGNFDFGLCPTPPDCTNPFCAADPRCHMTGHEICNNGIDDNDNGLIDCLDPQCCGSPFCVVGFFPECIDGGNFDLSPPHDLEAPLDLSRADLAGEDLLPPPPDLSTVCDPVNPNCADPRCKNDPKCVVIDCKPDVDFGVIPPAGGSVTRAFDTRNSLRSFATCAFPGGTAQVGVFRLTQTTSIKVDFAQQQGGAHVVDLFRAGTLQACDANPMFGGCIDARDHATATKSFANLGPGFYYVIVQSYPNTQGPSTVTISTGCPGTTEICNNGIDDNCNGLVDCADPACSTAPNCIPVECNPDINLGQLVVGDPPHDLTLETTQMVANRYHPTCAGASTGDDVVVRFTLHETDGILIEWQQTGNHVFGLFQEAASGLACDALQVSCFQTTGDPAGTLAFSPKPPGQYVLIFKPTSAATAGILQLSISAFRNGQKEICNNGFDDDGDGLVDCADPDCFGVPPCGAPLCLIDQDLGTIAPNTQASAMVNTSGGTTVYPTSCATGTGGERVLRFKVTQPIDLGLSCSPAPGTHVFQLAAEEQPLDPCNAHNINCFNPQIVFMSCNVALPNVQPGTYNMIIAAFQSGGEGPVNLTLFGIPTSVMSCTTQKDCMNSVCATAPFCQQFACKPTVRIGLLPLDGSTSNAVVQTSMGTTGANNVTCTTMPSGKYQDVDFQLPANANITISWAQVGNADIALFTDPNDLLACDAATQVGCFTTRGQQTGTINLSNLTLGRYHLMVKADSAGQEGGVVLQIKGSPAP